MYGEYESGKTTMAKNCGRKSHIVPARPRTLSMTYDVTHPFMLPVGNSGVVQWVLSDT